MSGSIRGPLYGLSYLLPFAVAVPLGIHLYTAPEPLPPPSIEPCNTLRVQFEETRGQWDETDAARIDSLVDAMSGQRGTCVRDPGYAQALSLAMQFDQRWGEGRSLFQQAARDGLLPPDAATVLIADIGLDEARWLRDEELERRGPDLVHHAEKSARAMLLRWPEWREAQSVYHLGRMAQDDSVYELPPASNPWIGFGRWAREWEQGQPQGAMTALGFLAGLMSGFGLRSLSRRHLLERTPITQIVQSEPATCTSGDGCTGRRVPTRSLTPGSAPPASGTRGVRPRATSRRSHSGTRPPSRCYSGMALGRRSSISSARTLRRPSSPSAMATRRCSPRRRTGQAQSRLGWGHLWAPNAGTSSRVMRCRSSASSCARTGARLGCGSAGPATGTGSSYWRKASSAN